jgi:hypothetical protein
MLKTAAGEECVDGERRSWGGVLSYEALHFVVENIEG